MMALDIAKLKAARRSPASKGKVVTAKPKAAPRISHQPGYWLERRYGITLKTYQAMVAEQHGCCLICDEVKPLQVDHCHETKKVRGLLCMHCNTGIGKLKHSAELLIAAMKYLADGVAFTLTPLAHKTE
jgi:hypothetical protein